jgi:hypothetical protein
LTFLKNGVKFKFLFYFLSTFNMSTLEVRGHGLEVNAEDLLPRGPGLKPPLWRPFFRHHSFRSKLETKLVENSNLALLHVL